jgi:L-asparaginase/beta-aspartyl-peptidase (threonine type)
MPADMRAWREGGDTVGTVARDRAGRFAATLSTGGTSVTLYGRVGDVPIYGAGLFAGPAGAVACTGHGEEIVRQALARSVYQAIEGGVPARAAVEAAAARFHTTWDVGLIAVDRDGWAWQRRNRWPTRSVELDPTRRA